MEIRVARIVDGYWRVSTADGEIPADEAANLEVFLREIRFPFHVDQYGVAIDGSVTWSEVEEQLLFFYDGVADVTPF